MSLSVIVPPGVTACADAAVVTCGAALAIVVSGASPHGLSKA